MGMGQGMHRQQVFRGDVGIALGRAQRCMPELLLDGAQVRPTLQHVRRAGVAKCVGMHTCYACFQAGLLRHFVHPARREAPSMAVQEQG